ncbi:hypothetical protein ACWU37_21065 (plasmid) [Photobacterium damselae subsp. damselae]
MVDNTLTQTTSDDSEEKQNKKWVFQLLTKAHLSDNGQPSVNGLIAYALYKARKDELATNLRLQGHPEDEISRRLKEFHETIAMSEREISSLLKYAEDLLVDLISGETKNINDKLKQEYDARSAKLNAEHENHKKELKRQKDACDARSARLDAEHERRKKENEKELKKLKDVELKKIRDAANNYSKPNKFVRFGLWVFSGFPSIIATSIAAVGIFGCVVFLGPEATKQDAKKQIFNWLFDSTTTVSMPKTPQAVSNAVITPQKTASVTK